MRGPSDPDRPQAVIRHSVSTRVVIGLSAIVALFSGLVTYSVFLYRNSVAEMELINTTYIPLALGTSEIQSTQIIFNTLTDRLAQEPNHPMTREWLNAARRYRPETLSRLISLIDHALTPPTGISTAERTFLKELRNRLRDVRRRYRLNENKFVTLFTELDMGRKGNVTAELEALKRSERLLNRVLAGIGDDIRTHIFELSSTAVRDGNTATAALAGLGSLALLIGVLIILSTRRLLAPLRQLQEAVSKVAAGNFRTRTAIHRDDEIGALAVNFDHMTSALLERDEKLRLSERLATAGRIAAQVTHEIRNPLTSLDLNADLLREEMEKAAVGDGDARQLLRAMQDEIERLTRITETYLRFARLPAPVSAPASLHQLIGDNLEFMAAELDSGHIVADLVPDARPDTAVFDREQMRQVIVNLLRNAMQAMPDGGRITIRTGLEGERIFMAVEDSGPGIPADMQPHVFDPFFTTKSTGTGLGLAMVKQICLAHGGEIRYRNGDDGGAVFTVFLETDGNPQETAP